MRPEALQQIWNMLVKHKPIVMPMINSDRVYLGLTTVYPRDGTVSQELHWN